MPREDDPGLIDGLNESRALDRKRRRIARPERILARDQPHRERLHAPVRMTAINVTLVYVYRAPVRVGLAEFPFVGVEAVGCTVELKVAADDPLEKPRVMWPQLLCVSEHQRRKDSEPVDQRPP